MNKKELRKELELTLVKTIDELLNKRNAEAAKAVRETTQKSSKAIAKKFYKFLKAKEKAVKTAAPKKPKAPAKVKAVVRFKPVAKTRKSKAKK